MSSRYLPCEKCGREVGESFEEGRWQRGRHMKTRRDDGGCDPADLEVARLRTGLQVLEEKCRKLANQQNSYGGHDYKDAANDTDEIVQDLHALWSGR